MKPILDAFPHWVRLDYRNLLVSGVTVYLAEVPNANHDIDSPFGSVRTREQKDDVSDNDSEFAIERAFLVAKRLLVA